MTFNPVALPQPQPRAGTGREWGTLTALDQAPPKKGVAPNTHRSVLWVGNLEQMAESFLVASPFFDVAWCRTVAEALELRLGTFDGVILPGDLEADALIAAGARHVVSDENPAPERLQQLLAEAPKPR